MYFRHVLAKVLRATCLSLPSLFLRATGDQTRTIGHGLNFASASLSLETL